MNELQKKLARAASDLGLKVEIGFALTFSDGRVVVSQALFPQLGHPRGTLIFCFDQAIDAAQRREIRALGYGMSTFGQPSPKVAYDASSYAETFAEWGWTGAPEDKPGWMQQPQS